MENPRIILQEQEDTTWKATIVFPSGNELHLDKTRPSAASALDCCTYYLASYHRARNCIARKYIEKFLAIREQAADARDAESTPGN